MLEWDCYYTFHPSSFAKSHLVAGSQCDIRAGDLHTNAMQTNA